MERWLFLFDIDGTLVKTGGVGLRALDRAFLKEYGIENAYKGYGFSGKTDQFIVTEGVRAHFQRDPRPDELQRLLEYYVMYVREEIKDLTNYRILEGVREFLDDLSQRKNYCLGLATGNLEEAGRVKIDPGGLNRYFPFGGFGSDAIERPMLVRKAIERGFKHMGETLPNDHVWVIGDSTLDIQAAHANQVVCTSIVSGWHTREELEALGPEHCFDTMADFHRWWLSSGM
jgi:phosphoglycolate phosphatase-like HAD superfamily hydrolase